MADDMDVGDCSSDGSCGGDDELMGGTPIAGVKVATTTLTEETLMALQQFSIGKQKNRKTPEKKTELIVYVFFCFPTLLSIFSKMILGRVIKITESTRACQNRKREKRVVLS